MQVQRFEIVNFKGIEAQSITPHGRNVYAIGANGKGKSSLIDAVFCALTGKNMPSKLTKEGARSGRVEVDLGDVKVVGTFDAKKEKMNLSVTTPEGAKYDAPRTMLDALVGTIDFDVAGFLALTPRKQVDYLKTVVGLDVADLDARYKKTFEERTESNRELKWLEGQNRPIITLANPEPIDLAQLQLQRQQLFQTNIIRKQRVEDEARLGREIERDEARLAELRLQVQQLDAEITAKANQRYDLDVWLTDNPHTPDDAIVATIAEAQKHNEQVAANAKEVAHREDVKKEAAKNLQLNNALAEIEAEKQARMAAVEMPVAGMQFGEDGLLLDGLPFESAQINTARRIIAGLQICSTLHKSVKIARFDGTLLDNASLREVEQWAAQNGIQLFVELVERDETQGLRVEFSESVTQ